MHEIGTKLDTCTLENLLLQNREKCKFVINCEGNIVAPKGAVRLTWTQLGVVFLQVLRIRPITVSKGGPTKKCTLRHMIRPKVGLQYTA